MSRSSARPHRAALRRPAPVAEMLGAGAMLVCMVTVLAGIWAVALSAI